MNEKLNILYEDADLIVCHKPAGVPVQSAKVGQKDMVSILNNYLAAPLIRVVHRLDQPVEGVLVFAKTKRAAAELSRQVADGSMKKIYQAVCCAVSAGPDGEGQTAALPENGSANKNGDYEPGREHRLVDYLVRDGRTNTSSVAEKNSRDAKRAELVFRVIGKRKIAPDCAGKICLLAEIGLKTGRHHQIRVQMAHAGLPLYGDRKYNESWQDFLAEADRIHLSGQDAGKIPLALCAVSLAFCHPVSKESLTFEITPQSDIFSAFGGDKR